MYVPLIIITSHITWKAHVLAFDSLLTLYFRQSGSHRSIGNCSLQTQSLGSWILAHLIHGNFIANFSLAPLTVIIFLIDVIHPKKFWLIWLHTSLFSFLFFGETNENYQSAQFFIFPCEQLKLVGPWYYLLASQDLVHAYLSTFCCTDFYSLY